MSLLEKPKTNALFKPTAHDIYTGRDPNRIKIFDTTLRDGEQSPGCTMNTDEKVIVAKQLVKLGVDVIEAGFPLASLGDFESVSKIAQTIGNGPNPPIICGFARALEKDISTCWDAVRHAMFPRIHLVLATSDIHMEYKLKKTREQILQMTTDMVGYAKTMFDDIEFCAEDALRSDPDFLCEAYSRAIEAGATVLNIPDTVGYTTPTEYGKLISKIRRDVRGVENVILSAHGHNDLGMAVANFMSAVENGARQLECTINGIGERAGNAALEEVVMALHVRKAYFNTFLGLPENSEKPITNINTQEIYKTSRLISSVTGMMVQANKAIVGANAFAHESGIHQDGILKHKRTYEIMDAESIGLNTNKFILGKHSGRHAFRAHLEAMGHTLTDNELNQAFSKFKEVSDKKKTVSEADIESIVSEVFNAYGDQQYKLVHIQVLCGDLQVPTATACVRDEVNNVEKTSASIGNGPFDAAINAVKLSMDIPDSIKLSEYSASSVSEGPDGLSEVTLRLRDEASQHVAFGRSTNTDIIVASAEAYIHGINRIFALRESGKIPRSGIP